MPCGEPGEGGWLICVWKQLVAQRHHAHYFLIRMPPSAKLLSDSPDGVIKPLQMSGRLVQHFDRSSRCQKTNEVVKNPEKFGLTSLKSLVLELCNVYGAWCPQSPIKVSQLTQLGVPRAPPELPVLVATLCLCEAFVGRNKFCSTM